ncbi:MAG: hypothetical protein RL173_1303 [Fibrobacterota bacterium]|jgi:hypothetical protein
MKLGIKLAIAATIVAGLSISIAWWWNHTFERKWVAAHLDQGDRPDQDHFALRKLLERQGIAVEFRDNLSQAQALATPNDAIYLPEPSSNFPIGLAKPLLAWVQSGGTLVARMPWEADSASEHLFRPLGVRVREDREDEPPDSEDTAQAQPTETLQDTTTDSVVPPPTDTGPTVILPGLPVSPLVDPTFDSTDSVKQDDSASEDLTLYEPDTGMVVVLPDGADTLRMLVLDDDARLHALDSAKVVWLDTLDSGIVVVAHGKGFVSAVSNVVRFHSGWLQDLDHAELALRLLSWRQKPTTVWIVRESTVMPWWAWLADRAWAILLVAALFAGLWFWNRVRRFGPLLPDPDTDRRPLLEHIDASARWIWNSPGGPDTLLSALRESVRRDLAVRHPGWVGLSLEELAQELSRLHDLSAAAVRRALDSDNFRQHAPSPQELVRTVKILRKLKERA